MTHTGRQDGREFGGLQFAEVRYRESTDDLLTLLDAQRTLFSTQDQLARIRLLWLLAAVSLFEALEGGWTDSRANARRIIAFQPAGGRIFTPV